MSEDVAVNLHAALAVGLERVVARLGDIVDRLDKLAHVREAEELADIEAATAFVMREACALEVERLYGPEAAAQVRLVTLPEAA